MPSFFDNVGSVITCMLFQSTTYTIDMKNIGATAVKPKTKKSSFVKGALILAVGGFIGKLIGAVYRIPLTNIIGAEGMGLYQMIFPLYALLLTVSSGGIPVALSRLIAEKCALNRHAEAGRMARNAVISLSILGLLCAVLVAALASVFANMQGNAEARLSYYAIAPAIAFVAVISALRGYFQGQRNMIPSAVSQIVEQVVKLGAGLGFAVLLLPRGVAYAAFGATLGVTVSEAVAMAALLVQRAMDKSKLPTDCSRAFLKDTKELYRLAIPVTLGGIVMPLTQLIDSGVVINALKSVVGVGAATSLYGLAGGPVGSLINMPVVISLAIATAVLPSVSASFAVGDTDMTRKKAGLSVRVTLLAALPCCAIFAIFARPIIDVLYGGGLTVGEMDEPAIAARLLTLSSVTMPMIALIQVSTNLLHAVKRNYTPVINLAIGAIVKIVLEITLLPTVGIDMVAYSNIACFGVASLLDLIMLGIYVRPVFPIARGMLAPLSATVLSTAVAYGLFRLIAPQNVFVGLAVAILFLVIIYLPCCLAFGVLTRKEAETIPLLSRITGFFSKKKSVRTECEDKIDGEPKPPKQG